MARPNSDLMVPVTLVNMAQAPLTNADGSTNIDYTGAQQTYAQIEPISTFSNLLNQQIEIGQITHEAFFRWDEISNFNEFSHVFRQRLQYNQIVRNEFYRIHRVMETTTSQWYVKVELEFLRYQP